MKTNYFLPYQMRWLNDHSKIKIWEKSRRIGATYVQSFEDVQDCINKRVPAVWFSSADESAAKEYIDYCENWVKYYHAIAKRKDIDVIDNNKSIKTFVIEFKNGTKIHALSSNPKAFRSKGGKVVLDEFAFHNNPEELWKAARPCITWGFPLRILSTHNGQNCLYYKFIDQVKKGKLNWSHHKTPIQLAVADGLVDKIYQRQTTKEEQEDWMQNERDNCFDEYTWQQEYCCIAVDEACAFLPYDLISSCELNDILKPLDEVQHDFYVGVDIGRRKDLTVIWVLEKIENIKYTRLVVELEKMPFHKQEEILHEILSHRLFRRDCQDDTGIGMQMAENAQVKFGKFRVEGVTFTNRVKEDLACRLRTEFENKTVFIPSRHEIREDLHSIRRITTASNNIRFDADRSDNGHADRFWALALALHAADNGSGEINISTRKRRESIDMVANF